MIDEQAPTKRKRRARKDEPAWTPADVQGPTTADEVAKANPLTPWQEMEAEPGSFLDWAQRQNMGSEQLARLLGLNRATVLELLAGRRWPSARTAMQIFETSGEHVRYWDVKNLTENIRVRVRPPEPRPRSGKRR